MQPVAIGTLLSVLSGIVGGAGTYGMGWLADRLGRRDVRWNMRAVAAALVVNFVFGAAFMLCHSLGWAILFLSLTT